MKKGIHPENYRLVVFKDMSNGTTTITKSTAATKETIEIDGVESVSYTHLDVYKRQSQPTRNPAFDS